MDEIKVGGDSCLPRHFANKNAKRKPVLTISSATVSQKPIALDHALIEKKLIF